MKILFKTAIGILIFRLLIAAFMPLSADEAYYYLYTVNLSPGYFDHPPMVALAGALFSLPFGSSSRFLLRLGPVFLFTFAIIPFFLLSKKFLDRREAVCASVIFLVVPIFFVSGALLLPDAALILFYTWGAYRFKRAIDEPSKGNWLIFGAVCGLALLSKYTGLFLLAGGFLYMFLDKDKKRLLFTSGPWLSAAAGFLIFSPVIYWNLTHNMASFLFHLGRGGSGGINLNYLGQFTAGQLGYILPFFFFTALYCGVRSVHLIKKNSFEKFIFCFGLIPVGFFFFLSLFVRTLPHWGVVGYIILCLPAGRFYAGLLMKRRKLFNFHLYSHFLLAGLLSSLALLQMHFGILRNRHITNDKIEESKRIRPGDISAAWMGWGMAVEEVEKLSGGEDFFLFTDRWFTGGYLAHACGGDYPVLVLSGLDGARGFFFWQNQVGQLGRDGFFITSSRFYSDRRRRYAPHFESVEFKKALPVKRRGKTVKYIYIYRYRNFKRPFPVIPSS